MVSVSMSHVRFVLDYPTRLLQQATGDYERRTRLQLTCDSGLKLKSVCSGIDAPGEATRVLQLAQQQATGQSRWVVQSSWCDIGNMQQQFLCERALEFEEHLRPCLFQSIEDHVAPDVRQRLGFSKPRPPPKSKAEQQAAMEYNEALGPQLNEARQEAFPEHHAAACLIHERRCCVQQDRVMPPGMLDKGANPLVGVAGGLPCIAYSKVGLMRKTGDPTEVAFQVWRSERKHLASEGREDFFLFENVQGYPIEEKIAQEMQDTHHIVTLPFSPKDCAA